jgi:hypothetical protein
MRLQTSRYYRMFTYPTKTIDNKYISINNRKKFHRLNSLVISTKLPLSESLTTEVMQNTEEKHCYFLSSHADGHNLHASGRCKNICKGDDDVD